MPERIRLGESEPWLIRESEVQAHLPMARALEVVETAFRDWAHGRATNQPRQRVHTLQGTLHLMGAAWRHYLGYKSYFSFAGGTRFVVVLASAQTGELLALIEADWLGRIRTGAATGVATRHLARPDAHRVALLGAGSQASTQLQAVCAVRPVQTVRVYSRTPERSQAFCKMMSDLLEVELSPVATVEQAMDGADIVITVTSAREPLVSGAMLKPGMHLNAVGANSLARRELDTHAVARCDRIFVDDVAQARIESAELVLPIELRRLSWERVLPLASLVGGLALGRQSPEEITLFKSLGIALEDVAVASAVYESLIG